MQLKPIDISAPGACVEFDKSLKETGFAIVNLRSPDFIQLLDKVYAEWANFFNDHTFKVCHHFAKYDDQSGYFPFRSENAKDSKFKDLKEFFHLYKEEHLPITLSKATWELRKELVNLSETLLLWLDLCGDFHDQFQGSERLIDMIKGSEQTLLRVLHYPPLVWEGQKLFTEEPRAVRAAAHEDINLITLLPSATQSGLQVKTTEGGWYDVPGEKGWIIVNAGDMLQEVTRGYYKSTTHRVVNPEGEEATKSRYSMPLFLHPRPDVRLSQKYTAGEYLDERLKEIGIK